MRSTRSIPLLAAAALVAAAAPIPIAPAPARAATWVLLRDRGPDAAGAAHHAALAAAERGLTPRALARRAKAARERDARDGGSLAGEEAALVDDADLEPA